MNDRPDEPSPRNESRQQSYVGFMTLYSAVAAGLVGAGAKRRDRIRVPQALDVVLLGVATHKLSRLLTKDVITTPLRAPLTELDGPGNPGELNEEPTGRGLSRSLGELITCPFCLDVWIATGLTGATVLTPRFGRTVIAGLTAVGIADYLHFGYSAADRLAEG